MVTAMVSAGRAFAGSDWARASEAGIRNKIGRITAKKTTPLIYEKGSIRSLRERS